jgi:hypothetical protein
MDEILIMVSFLESWEASRLTFSVTRGRGSTWGAGRCLCTLFFKIIVFISPQSTMCNVWYIKKVKHGMIY